MRSLFRSLLGLLGLSAFAVTQADATEYCGQFCVECDYFSKAAEYPSVYSHQNYDPVCQWRFCGPCPSASIDANAPSAGAIVAAVEGAGNSSLQDVYSLYGDRILLDHRRGLAVVLGGCDRRTPAAIVYTEQSALRTLDALGAQTLDEFLSGPGMRMLSDGEERSADFGWTQRLRGLLSSLVEFTLKLA